MDEWGLASYGRIWRFSGFRSVRTYFYLVYTFQVQARSSIARISVSEMVSQQVSTFR